VDELLSQLPSDANAIENPSGLLVILSGPSGVGKDSVYNQMKTSCKPYIFAVTATTRSPRPNEKHEKDYIFLSPAEFDEIVDTGGFLEWAQVYGNRYGVPKAPINDALAKGQTVVIKTDVQGASTIKKLISRAIFIFLAPASMKELEHRLRNRLTESKPDVSLRLRTAKAEMGHQAMFDYTVINHEGELERTVSKIEAIINKEQEGEQPTTNPTG